MRNRRHMAAALGGVLLTLATTMVLSSTALAATTTAAVNVRAQPSTSAPIRGQLRAGETVNVQGCQPQFCYIDNARLEGWVSRMYLTGAGVPRAGLNFDFSLGADGRPNFSVGIGNGAGPADPARPGRFPPGGPGPVIINPGPPPSPSEACFYDRTSLRGDSFCVSEGESISNLGRSLPDWNDAVRSIENVDGLAVTVCQSPNFQTCRTYTSSANTLGGGYDGNISSIRVQ